MTTFKFSSSTKRKHLTFLVEVKRVPQGLVINRIWRKRQISADKWSEWCPGKSEILVAHYIKTTVIH